MATQKFFFAGSGGQGILLMGQMISYAAMYDNKATTFLPSYGPEMRGGTANCTVVVDDASVNCPVIYEADIVVAMNLPSLLKFESLVKPGGKLFINTSLADHEVTRTDIEVIKLPVNDMAAELGNPRTANIIMLGAVLSKTDIVSQSSIDKVLEYVFSGRKAVHLELNKKAIKLYENLNK